MFGYMKLKLRERVKASAVATTPWYRSRPQKQKQPQPAPEPALPTVAEVVDHDFLLAVYDRLRREKGQAPGRDGLDYRAFGHSEIAQATRTLEQCVLDGSYQPYDYRSVFIRKKSGKKRELKLRNILDRLVATALYEKSKRNWEAIFLPPSYGFRPGNGAKYSTGVWPLLADLVLTIQETGLSVLAIDDVEQAFDNLDLQLLLACHAQHIKDAALLAFTEKVLRGGDATKVKGIDQGSAYSPLALNVYLHFAHDLVLAQDPAHPLWWRYADNLVYLCEIVPEAYLLLQKVRHRLGEARLTLKGLDGPPMDLNTGVAKLLGFTLTRQGQSASLGLSDDALDDLKQHLVEAHKTDNPSAAAHTAIRGWVNAYGPAFGLPTDGHTLVHVLRTAANCGFREVASLETLTQTAGNARKRWDACLQKVADRRLAAATSATA